jgi:hypothetical protein
MRNSRASSRPQWSQVPLSEVIPLRVHLAAVDVVTPSLYPGTGIGARGFYGESWRRAGGGSNTAWGCCSRSKFWGAFVGGGAVDLEWGAVFACTGFMTLKDPEVPMGQSTAPAWTLKASQENTVLGTEIPNNPRLPETVYECLTGWLPQGFREGKHETVTVGNPYQGLAIPETLRMP